MELSARGTNARRSFSATLPAGPGRLGSVFRTPGPVPGNRRRPRLCFYHSGAGFGSILETVGGHTSRRRRRRRGRGSAALFSPTLARTALPAQGAVAFAPSVVAMLD